MLKDYKIRKEGKIFLNNGTEEQASHVRDAFSDRAQFWTNKV